MFFGIFALFAATGAWKLRGSLHETAANHDDHVHLLVSIGVTLGFGYFFISSFLRARRREARTLKMSDATGTLSASCQRDRKPVLEFLLNLSIALRALMGLTLRLRWVSRGSIHLRAGFSQRCIAGGFGRCGSMRAWATPRSRTGGTSFCWNMGTKGLSVAFDLPTQIGYDSDSPLALGEVGKVGVAIDSIEDMERLFDGIRLDAISTSMTINATASILLALYVAVARRQGADVKKLNGTIQNDILKEYIARGTYIYPVRHAMRLVTDIFAWAADEVPEWNTISISGYHMREAGCTAVQEVAFTLANGMTYVQAAIDAGLDVDVFAPRLSFFFNAHNNLLEEVAKFRAARRMWAQIMREHFGAKNPRSWMLRFHTQTAGSTLTAQQPENNIVRTTLQALAAVLGGRRSAYEWVRRGTGAADGAGGADCSADPADSCA